MTNRPDWLPEPLRYAGYDGNWDRFLAAVYSVFVRDFKMNRVSYRGKQVDFDRALSAGKEEGFWHIVSEQQRDTDERLPDLRRCERIPWPRPTIEHPSEAEVSVWQNKRRSQTRTLLWLEHLDYLVVLQEKRRSMILVTAYCTDHEHTRRKLRRERDSSGKKQAPPSEDDASTPPTRGR